MWRHCYLFRGDSSINVGHRRPIQQKQLQLVSELDVQMIQRTKLTFFSRSKAAWTASRAEPHSSLLGLAMSWNTTRPPRKFWYFMNSIA